MLGWPVVEFVFGHVRLTMRTPIGPADAPGDPQGRRPAAFGSASATLDRAGVERHDAKARRCARAGRPMLADGTVLDVANVIWATGYRPDYSFVAAPIVGDDGWPIEKRGVSPTVEGLYFLGVPFQYAFTSMLVAGASRDAKYVVEPDRGARQGAPRGGKHDGGGRALRGIGEGSDMTDQAVAIPAATSGIGHYLAAERRLWDAYDLAPTERFVQLDQPRAKLRILEVGSGRPALFLHGTIGPGGWASLVGNLPGHRALVLDRPGWGLSDPVDLPGSGLRAFLGDLLAGALDEAEARPGRPRRRIGRQSLGAEPR